MKNSSFKATILLLDSDPLMRVVLTNTLQSEGYLVAATGNVGTAADRIDDTPPDLLIIRPYVNSMPGHLAADYLRVRCPGLPVLIVAGFIDDDRVSILQSVDNFHLFPPPFSRDQLLAKVADLVKAVPGRTEVRVERELTEVRRIADTMKLEHIIAWCEVHPDEVPFALHELVCGSGIPNR